MTADGAEYTLAERTQIAKQARRSALSEGSAVWSVGGVFLFLGTFMFGMNRITQLSDVVLVSPTAIALFFSFGVSGLLALFHIKRLKPKIAKAQELDASFKYAQQDKLRKEREAKIAAMQTEDTTNNQQ